MLRRFILAAAAVAVLAVPLALAGPASAAGSFYMVAGDGTGYSLHDNGHNNLMTVDGRTTTFTEINADSGWVELQMPSGLCVDIGSNDYAYSESCQPGLTPEEFSFNNHIVENRHFGLNLTTLDNNNGLVFVGSGTGIDSQWATPGA